MAPSDSQNASSVEYLFYSSTAWHQLTAATEEASVTALSATFVNKLGVLAK